MPTAKLQERFNEDNAQLLKIVSDLLGAYPRMAAHCKTSGIVSALEEFGLYDQGMLDVALRHPWAAEKLACALQDVAPMAFVALLSSSRFSSPVGTPSIPQEVYADGGERKISLEIHPSMREPPSSCTRQDLGSQLPVDRHGREVDATSDTQEHASLPRYPGRLLNFMKVSSFSEKLGIFLDHSIYWKKHWIAAAQADPERLRSSVMFQCEFEFLFGTFLFSAFLTALLEMPERLQDDFRRMEVRSSGFWMMFFCLTGTLSTVCQALLCYLTIALITPISKANLYIFCKSSIGCLATYVAHGNMLVSNASSMAFVSLLVVEMFDKNAAAIIIVCGVVVPVLCLVGFLGNAMNIALHSGCFSSKPIVDSKTLAGMSPGEVEELLSRRALKTVNTWGKTGLLSSGTDAILNMNYHHLESAGAESDSYTKAQGTSLL